MTDERRYSEAELHAIFERAAKRQEEARHAEAASRGALTLAELQEIGVASGIDPAHVAAAAAELHTPPPADVHTFLGAPTEVERTRVFPYDVSDEEWARMVTEVRRSFDDDGSIGQIGQMREWTAVKRTASTMRLTLEPVTGGTRATLRQSVREKGFGIAAAIHAAIALVFLLLGAVTEPELLLAGAMMAMVALVFAGGARGWLSYWRPKQEKTFEAVLDRIELIAHADAGPAPERAATPEAGALPSPDRIDLDALPEEPRDPQAGERSRTRS